MNIEWEGKLGKNKKQSPNLTIAVTSGILGSPSLHNNH